MRAVCCFGQASNRGERRAGWAGREQGSDAELRKQAAGPEGRRVARTIAWGPCETQGSGEAGASRNSAGTRQVGLVGAKRLVGRAQEEAERVGRRRRNVSRRASELQSADGRRGRPSSGRFEHQPRDAADGSARPASCATARAREATRHS